MDDFYSIPLNLPSTVLNTSGKGIWSSKSKAVKIKSFEVMYEKSMPISLKVFFDIKNWDVKKDGLIYTDPQFEFELNLFLSKFGYKIMYSEQGLQGIDYVDFDIIQGPLQDNGRHHRQKI